MRLLRLAVDAFQRVVAQLERLGEQALARREKFFPWQGERPLWRLIVGSGCIHPLGISPSSIEPRNESRWERCLGEMARSMVDLDDSSVWQGEVKYTLACMHSLLGAKAEGNS